MARFKILHSKVGGMDFQMTIVSGAMLLLFAATVSQAQTYTVLHNLSGGIGGDTPLAGVTLDQQGRIYGTTEFGGRQQHGMVYRLARQGEGWVFSPIYSFGSQQDDGNNPQARVLFGPNGLLYGTTSLGGIQNNGIVFSLQPPPTACKAVLCPWVETVLYRFTGGADGGEPFFGDLTFDQAGNIYGTTVNSGSSGDGVVYKLTRSGSGWTESVLWTFLCGNDGCVPLSGVIFDSAGNLYGTTSSGGANGLGTVYELSPTQSGWSETTLYSFTSDTSPGAGGLVMDAHGDLFGMTGGVDDSTNVAFELTPQNGSWSFSVLQMFGEQEATPVVGPTLDSQGNLYGPLTTGGIGVGEIFKLTPSGDQWIYSPFYQFSGCIDGCFPYGAVTFGAGGNMYGTTSDGGSYGYGTVWEITP